MDLSSLIDDTPLRSAQIVGTADTLLTDTTDTIMHAKDPVLATTQTTGGDATSPIDGFVPLANDAILEVHQVLEALADQNGLIGSVHGLTNLGETLGLGHLGGANLATDALDAPTGLAGGNTSIIGHLVPDGLPIVGALGGLGTGTAQDAGANPALLGPIGDILPEAQALPTQPVEQLANDIVLDLHATLEAIGHDLDVADGFHGLTNLGETVGLGRIGDANLVTDALATPGALLAGDLTPIMHVPADLGAIAVAAQTFVSDTENDLANIGNVLSNPVGHIQSLIPTLEAFPATALANEAIDTVHGILETVLDPIIPGTIHGIIGTGNALGLGELGGQNALTDLLNTPTALLSGDTSPLTHLPSDLGQVGTAVGGLLGGIGADLSGSSLVGALTHPATGGGLLGGSLPGAGIVGTATGLVDGAVNGLGDATGLGGITHALTGAAGAITGGSSSPLTGLLQVPGELLGGASNGAAPLPGDGGTSLGSLGSVVGAVAGEVSQLAGAASPLAPVTGVLSGGTGGLVGTVTGALGGATSGGLGDTLGTVAHADPTGLVSSLVGTVAPVTGGGTAGLLGTVTNALGGATGGGLGGTLGSLVHADPTGLASSVGGVGGLLPDSIQLPTATAGGSDALSGVLQLVTGSGASTSGSASTGLDLGIVHVDVPIAAAHADPLGLLGLAAHHA